MKRVLMAAILFLSVSGIALAQTTPKKEKDTSSHSKMTKDHVKKAHAKHHKKANA